jgi:hypothetical protein
MFVISVLSPLPVFGAIFGGGSYMAMTALVGVGLCGCRQETTPAGHR